MTLATTSTRQRATLSLETVLFAALFALALAARLANLGAHPLNDAEAREALTVWRFTQGLAGTTLPASPAYLTLTALAFSIFGNMDFVPRLAPALAGAALTLMPWLAREALGRQRALLTAALLTVSSIVLTASRSADGTLLAVFFVVLTAIAAWRLASGRGGTGWAVIAGSAFGASLASGPEAFVGLIALAFAVPLIPGAWDALMSAIIDRGRLIAVAVLAGLVVTATFLLLNRDGLGAAAGSLVTFAQRFNPSSAGRTLTALIGLAVLYDPLIVVAGVISLPAAFAREPVDRLAASAVVVTGTVIIASSGRSQFDLVWLIVFLAPLAAHALWRVIAEFDWRDQWGTPLILAGLLIALTAFVILNLAQFAETLRANPALLEEPANWLGTWRQLGLAIFGLVIIPIVVALIALGWSARAALHGTAGVATVLLLAATLAGGWSQNQGRPGSPAELWWPHPVGADLARLRQTLLWSGEQAIGEGTEIDVVAQASPDGALAWALRDFSKARFVSTLGPDVAASAVITSASADSTPPVLAAAYVGSPFAIDPVWFPDTLFWNEQLNWLLFRRVDIQYPTLTILWLRDDIQAPPTVSR